MSDHAEQVKAILDKAAKTDPELFMRYYSMLLEYFKPKLARSENDNKNSGAIDVRVSYGRKTD